MHHVRTPGFVFAKRLSGCLQLRLWGMLSVSLVCPKACFAMEGQDKGTRCDGDSGVALQDYARLGRFSRFSNHCLVWDVEFFPHDFFWCNFNYFVLELLWYNGIVLIGEVNALQFSGQT